MLIGEYCYMYDSLGRRKIGRILYEQGTRVEVALPSGKTQCWEKRDLARGYQYRLDKVFIKEADLYRQAVIRATKLPVIYPSELPELPRYSHYELGMYSELSTTPSYSAPKEEKYLSNKFNFLTINQDE